MGGRKFLFYVSTKPRQVKHPLVNIFFDVSDVTHELNTMVKYENTKNGLIGMCKMIYRRPNRDDHKKRVQ